MIALILFANFTAAKDEKYFSRAVGRSENPGVPVLFGGHNLPLLVGQLICQNIGTPRDDRPKHMHSHIDF